MAGLGGLPDLRGPPMSSAQHGRHPSYGHVGAPPTPQSPDGVPNGLPQGVATLQPTVAAKQQEAEAWNVL